MTLIVKSERGAAGRSITLPAIAALNNMGAHTVVVYCRIPSAPSVPGYMIGKTAGGSFLRFLVTSTGQLGYGRNSTGSGNYPEHVSAASAVNTSNVWQHLQLRCDGTLNGTGMRLKVNAAADLTGGTTNAGAGSLVDDSANPLILLNRSSLGREFVADVAYIAIWPTTELSDAQLTSVRDNGPQSVAGAVICWANEVDYGTAAATPTARTTFVDGGAPTNQALGDASAATALLMSGPNSGTVSVASSPFTVSANGTITGTINVAPVDGGAGGTFTPTSVNISAGTPTATFTYTAASTGTKTISTTHNAGGGIANATPINYASNAAGGFKATAVYQLLIGDGNV
jgi:hypothetical protein